MKVVGILLAAGFSTRFGNNKLLALLPPGGPGAGTPVSLAAARHLVEALPESVAVVRPRAQKVSQWLREAGCKTVVGTRLKRAGMRWTVAGANAVIALRCRLLGNRWEDLWRSAA